MARKYHSLLRFSWIALTVAACAATGLAAQSASSDVYAPSMKFAHVFGRDVEVRREGAVLPVLDPTLAEAERASDGVRSNVTARDAVHAIMASVRGAPTTCAGVESLRLPWIRVTSAQQMPAQKNTLAYCKVLATVDKEINIEVDLPAPSAWNGKFLMGGSGAFLGDLGNGSKAVALHRGYATAVTDTGHLVPKDIPGASWAYRNPERLVNFGYRATHVAQASAKLIIRAYYKRPIRHAYFYGTSGSGRQAMMEVQRYPDDFDGIIAGCPGFSSTRGTALMKAWTQQVMFPTLQDHNNYTPVVPPQKVKLLDDVVHKKCDGVDGLVDGVITHPPACKFDPNKDLPKCSSGTDTGACFTAAQIEAIDKVHKGPSNADGQIWAGMPYGGESIDGQWTSPNGGAVIGSPTANKNRSIGPYYTRNYFMANENLRYFVFGDPAFDLHDFNFETDMLSIAPAAAQIDADNPDLSGWRRRGGKLLIYAGWSDWSINPLAQVDYYERVLAKMGGREKVADFARLFLIPGNGHCNVIDQTKKVPNVADFLTELEGWVEEGKKPNRIIASYYADPKSLGPTGLPIDVPPARTRPICPYPRVAVYKGSGSIDDAANFACGAPP